MKNHFQDKKVLESLYGSKDSIALRGNFLKEYSNRKYSLRSFVIKLLPKINHKKILDIGCGDCSFLEKLRTKYTNNEYFGLDIVKNKKCCDISLVNYKIYDGKHFPEYSDTFDVIFCMHTLYHIRSFKLFFVKVKEYLSNSGTLIITTKSKFTLPKIENTFLKVVNKIHLKEKSNIPKYRDESTFCLENGPGILKKHFPKKSFKIEEYVLETQIIVDDKQALLEYIFSTDRYNLDNKISDEMLIKEYKELWQKELGNNRFFIDKYIEVVYLIKSI